MKHSQLLCTVGVGGQMYSPSGKGNLPAKVFTPDVISELEKKGLIAPASQVAAPAATTPAPVTTPAPAATTQAPS